MRLFRFGAIIGRALQAEKRITSGDVLRVAAILTLALVVLAGAAQWVVNDEVKTLWDGVWWAVVTATTVGYGDVPITTAAGRIIGILVMAMGVAFVSLLTAAIAARFVRTDESGTRELRDTLARIEADLAAIKTRVG